MLGLNSIPCVTSLNLALVQIRKVDSEILVAVRQQSSSGSRARSAIPPVFLRSNCLQCTDAALAFRFLHSRM